MTNCQQLCKFVGLPSLLVLAVPALGCSGAEVPPDGAAGSGGSGASGGSSGSGTSGSGATSGSSGSDELIGSFQVNIKKASSAVEVLGRVNDTPLPSVLVWDLAQEDGDCQLLLPTAPFCDPGCGAEICQPDNVCVPYPVGQNVGEVTLSGVKLETGETTLVLKEVAKNYQPPPGTKFAFPPFEEGDEVSFHAAGAVYPGFDVDAPAVAPLSLTSTDFALEEGKAFELKWDAASDPGASRVHVKLNISHHGGTKGEIKCDTDDDGELTISAELMTELIGLGVAGFPTVEVTRASSSMASITQGRIELVVSAFVGQGVTIAGLDSCTATSCDAGGECIPCPEGKTCQSDFTCH
jgi:hypothetical protein